MEKQNQNQKTNDKALEAINGFQQSCITLAECVNEKLFGGDRPGGYWVGNDVGGTYDFGDTDFLTPEEMVLILMHNMTYDEYNEWNEANIVHSDKDHYINLKSWLMGARYEMFDGKKTIVAPKIEDGETTEELEQRLAEAKRTLEDALEDVSLPIEQRISLLLQQEPDIALQRDELKAILSDKDNSQDFLSFIDGLKDLHEDFERLMSSIRDKIHNFQILHPQQLTTMGLYHIEGNPYSKQPGKGETMHCLTNILDSEDEPEAKAHIIEILFRNCKMSRAFRDMIVGTYLCCKAAGIADGMYVDKK